MPAGHQRSKPDRGARGSRAVGRPEARAAGRPEARAAGRPEAGDGPGAGDGEDQDPTGLGDPKDPEAVARQICLRLLTVAPRTRAQLADALRRRGVPGPAAEAVLDRFTEVGLVDDPAFARAWVESRHHSRGLSRSALKAELHRRGVAAADVGDAIETLDPEQEVATARHLIASRVASTRGQPPAARMRRLVGVLARKGYGAALAYRVVREALEQEGAELAEAVPEPPEPDPDMGEAERDWYQ